RCSAYDEQGFVRTEDARCIALTRRDGSGVIEQRARRSDRDRHVRSNGVLPEELIEQLPDRTLPERDTTAVTGSVPGIAAVESVVHQRFEHGRGQAFDVELRRPANRASKKFR